MGKRFTITGEFRDLGRLYLATSVDLNLRTRTWASPTPDAQFGTFTEQAAQRVIARVAKRDPDWRELRVEQA